MFGDLTHESAIKLAQQLIDITLQGLNRVFLCDAGSVAVAEAMQEPRILFFLQRPL
jgi:adenosylmethionine-8-amino-7-oxononanoate aminotransferase